MFFTDEHPGSVPIHLVHEEGFDTWRDAQDEPTRNWFGANGCRPVGAEPQCVRAWYAFLKSRYAR